MADVKIVGGGELDGAVLQGAATEATLQKLIDKLGGPSSRGGRSAKEMAQAKSMAEVTASAKGASTAFDDYVSKHKKFSTVFEDFGMNFVKGTDKFGDFTSSLTGYMSQFGVGFALMAQGIQRLVDELDQQIVTFRTLSAVGADFGSSLFDSRYAAIDAGLSLETFSAQVSVNANSFALLGGSVNAGVKRFTAISKVLQKDAQPMFSKFGLTMEETTDMLTDYLEIQTGLGRAQDMSNQDLVEGTTNYIKELDLLARVTGISRKEASEAMKLQQQDKILKSLMMSMTEEQSLRLGGMLAGIGKVSPAMADAVKELVVTGGAPISANAKGLALINPQLLTLAAGLRDGSTSNEAFQMELRRTAEMAKAQGASMGDQMALQQLLGNDMMGAGAMAAQFAKFGEKSVEALKEQAAAEESAGKVAADFSNQMRKLMNSIIILFKPLFYAVELLAAGLTAVMPALKYVMIALVAFGGTLLVLKGIMLTLAAVGAAKAAVGTAGGVGKFARGAYETGKEGLKNFVTGKSSTGAGTATGGGSGSKVLESIGKGGPTMGASLKGLAGGLAAFGVKAPLILIGAAAVGGAITLIGAGIAGAAWLMGGAFSKFADDIQKFNSIDGQNLKSVASGAMALSGAMATFGVGSIISGFGSMFGGDSSNLAKNINATLDSLDKDKIEGYTVALENLSESFAGLNSNMSKTITASGKTSGDKLEELNNTMRAMLTELQGQKRFVKQTAEAVSEG